MAELALGTWITTAFLGGYLFTFASDGGRPEGGAPATRLPPLVLFVHPVLGLSGIALWIGYLSTDSAVVAWVGVAILAAGGLIGGFLAMRTERHRRNRSDRVPVAEHRIPRPAIALHGLGAALTFALVLTVALRA